MRHCLPVKRRSEANRGAISCGRNAATRRGRTERFLEVRAYVIPHLVMPVGPLVAALRAPVVQMMRYAAALEYFGHLVGRAGHFPWAAAGREVDVAAGVVVSVLEPTI